MEELDGLGDTVFDSPAPCVISHQKLRGERQDFQPVLVEPFEQVPGFGLFPPPAFFSAWAGGKWFCA